LNKYVILNGSAACGKDEFVKKCKIYRDDVVNMSSVDFVKTVGLKCGWDGKKDERGRRFLSDLKDALTRYDDIPVKHILEDIAKYENSLIFIHCREPEEIEKLKNILHAKTVLVVNENAIKIESNHADQFVINYNYDYIIDNSGSLGDLLIESYIFLQWLEVNYEKV
jgi:hypothetical protein